MAPNTSPMANRIEGRLFSDEGRLCMIVSVDQESSFARVSCRVDGEQRVVEMPISEVSLRLAAFSRVNGGSTAESTERIVEKPEGWFFVAREGMQGPYPTDAAANDALNAHIVSLQTTTSNYR